MRSGHANERAAEAALARAALEAGDLDRPALDLALAEVARRRALGEALTLPQLLAPRLGPAARARLAEVYRAARAADATDATWLPGGEAAGAPAPPPGRPALASLARRLPGPGDRFEGFVVERELGRGAMGAVYVARDRARRAVALKVILPSQSASEREVRFEREAQATARLDHPGIVRIHAHGRDVEGRSYLVMDLVEGEALQARLERQPAGLPWPEVARLGRALADALAHAHDRGVLHRDLKPANVLVTADGAPRLVDFGLARAEGEAPLTATGALLGTPAFMAPEQVSGRPSTPATDVYGLGATLYAALVGAPPFCGRPLPALLAAALSEPPPPPRAKRPDLPPDLELVLLRCLAKAPAQRYAAAVDLARDLDAVLEGRPLLPPPPAPRRPRRALAAALAVALAAALALGVRSAARPPDAATPDEPAGPAPPAAAPREVQVQVPATCDALVLRLDARAGRWTLSARSPEDPPSGPAPWRVTEDARAGLVLVVARGGGPPLGTGPVVVRAEGPGGATAEVAVELVGRGRPCGVAPLTTALGRPSVDEAFATAAERDQARQLLSAAQRAMSKAALDEALAGLDALALGSPNPKASLIAAGARVDDEGPQDEVGGEDRPAERALALAAARMPGHPYLGWLEARAELRRGRDVEARERFRALAERFPNLAPPRLALARVLERLGDRAEALDLALSVAARDPDHPEASRLVGELDDDVHSTPATLLRAAARLWLAFQRFPADGRRVQALEGLVARLRRRAATDPDGAAAAARLVLERLAGAPSSTSAAEQGLGLTGARHAAAVEAARARCLALAGERDRARRLVAALRDRLPPGAREARVLLEEVARELP